MLLLFLACTAKGPDSRHDTDTDSDTDTDTDTDTDSACFEPGVYGDPSGALRKSCPYSGIGSFAFADLPLTCR